MAHRGDSSPTLERIVSWTILLIVLAVLVGAPLAFGATHVVWWTLGVLLSLAAGVLWCLRALVWGCPPIHSSARIVLSFGMALLALAILQLVPLPVEAVRTISPATLRSFSVAFGEDLPAAVPLSLSPERTRQGLLVLAGALSMFLCVSTLANNQRRLLVLWIGIALTASFSAAYGLVQRARARTEIFGNKREHYLSDVTGTYVNRNHFAGLLAMSIPLTVGAAALSWRRRPSRRGAEAGLEPFAANRPLREWRVLVPAALFAILFTGLFASGSRAGVACGLVSMPLMLFCAAPRKRLGVGVMVVCCLAAVAFFTWPKDRARFDRESLSLALRARIAVWKGTIALASDHPLFGTGLATFRSVYPSYREETLANPHRHAHNDYLQLAAEMGAPVAIAGLIVIAIWYSSVVSVLRIVSRPVACLTVGALGSVSALLLHELVDFNLRIPANLWVFSAIMAGGSATGLMIGARDGRFRRKRFSNE